MIYNFLKYKIKCTKSICQHQGNKEPPSDRPEDLRGSPLQRERIEQNAALTKKIWGIILYFIY